jgi:hypothetical protein
MDQSVLSYCVIYQIYQSVVNSILKKICTNGHNHSSDGPWLVVMCVDYYSTVAIDIHDVIMPVTTIYLE